MIRRLSFIAAVLGFFWCGGFLRAQSPNASLTGRVTDPTKAVIVDARIVATNVATNVRSQGLTNGAGEYYIPDLLPGTYRIEAEKAGFNTVIKPEVVLHVQDAIEINFEMTLGSLSESVTIEAGAPMVHLASSDLGAVVDANSIRELPLNGRSWTDLATLQAGVSGVDTQINYTSGSGRGNRGFGAFLSISGGRPQQNNYRVDGVSVDDYTNGGPGSVLGGTLGVDAIEEFSVLTTNYPAEYGRTSGGVINAITRSGTNDFHGAAYEFLRNSDLDARNFFDPSSPPPFRRNQFGGAGGGPLWKDRTFFFVDYEGIRQSTGLTEIATVPSAAARAGNLSTGNVVVDPSAAKYLTFWPLPNDGLLGSGDTGLYRFAGQQVVNENFVTGRLDHKLTSRDTLFATFTFDDTPYTAPDNLGDVLLGDHTTRYTLAAEETHQFGPEVLNSVRVGYNREDVLNNWSMKAVNPAAADPSLGAVPGEDAALVTVGGLSPFNGGMEGGSPWTYNWKSYQLYDDAFFTRGRHSLKFGFAFERMHSDMEAYSDVTGGFSFGSLEQFLTNQPSRLIAAFPGSVGPRQLRQSLFATYVQDDWRMSPNLTVNLGLRYEVTTVPTEVHGELSTLLNIADPTPHLGSPLFQNPTLLNFEPRVGLAWDPTGGGKTAVRAAFGIYDVLPLPYEFSLLETRSAPYFSDGTASKLPAGSFYQGALALLSQNTLAATWIEQHPKRDYVMQWNMSIERELARNLTATIAYVGTHGVHQPLRIDDANIVMPTLTDAGWVWPSPQGSGTIVNPNFGQIRIMDWEGSSLYDALEFSMIRRMSHGLQVRGAYTWGKSIDTSSSSIAGDGFISAPSSLVDFDLNLDRGLSDFNVAQSVVIAGTWQVPAPRSLPDHFAWAEAAGSSVPFSARTPACRSLRHSAQTETHWG